MGISKNVSVSPHVANVLDCNFIVSRFKVQWYYDIHF